MAKDTQGIDTSINLVGIATVQARQGEKIENIEADCSEIKTCLLGNGQPGLVTRTDRLEQKDALKTKLFWVVVAAVAGLVVSAVYPEIIASMSN